MRGVALTDEEFRALLDGECASLGGMADALPGAGWPTPFAVTLAERLKKTGKLTDVTAGPTVAPRLDVEVDGH